MALERYLKLDHQKEIDGWNEKARWLASQLQGIRGLDAQYAINTKGYADVDLSWDESIIPITHDELRPAFSPEVPGSSTTEPRSGSASSTTTRWRWWRDG